ncbi:unnamed protein product [Diatraea saccharalis]|uniref:Dolichyl-phosphate beta-glucosyltransferase n=1 Tax=Diatraea saccharalis TaxID=40085 RepID=A0A9N9R9N4_9NEOP|nr:unnamed protein product [Diatraea saccharalis]
MMEMLYLFCSIIFQALLVGIFFLMMISVVIYLTTNPYAAIERFQDEEFYKVPQTKAKIKFPSIDDPQSINLSIIVPAYNEEERLPAMLDESIQFLENRSRLYPTYKYEIIIVSDGSKDKTVNVAESYVEKFGTEKIRCLELIKNRGKGGAVQLGVQSSRGSLILFADADGASKFEDLKKLEGALEEMVKYDIFKEPSEIENCCAIAIGSRAHLEKESLAKRSIFRNILMFGFHFLVWLFTVKGIKDTQCGFKLFTRSSARICFKNLHVNRWAFDVELLYIAQKLNIPISEIPVRWTEIDGSKVTPVLSWIQMGWDLGLIWLKYTIGAWKIKSDKTN